ncbi:N-acetyl-D-glucosamine kinase, partial [Pasteurella multocida subsp. multocida str. Anand1_buffalo]
GRSDFNGKVHSGQTGMAGEVGHTQLNYHALRLLGGDNAPIYDCGCGNRACLDTYLSGRGFEMLYRDMQGEALSAQAIIQRFMPVTKVRSNLLNFLLSFVPFQ